MAHLRMGAAEFLEISYTRPQAIVIRSWRLRQGPFLCLKGTPVRTPNPHLDMSPRTKLVSSRRQFGVSQVDPRLC